MKFIFLIPLFALTACSTQQVNEPIISHQVINKTIPSELLEIPTAPPAPDLTNATQKDVSLWLLESEKRVKQLENQIRKIKQYNQGE